MLADLFLSVADAVISCTIDKLDPAETLKTWLKRDTAKLAFQKALARTYAAFARQYPEYAASLFDQSFLSKEAIPEISKLLIRSQHCWTAPPCSRPFLRTRHQRRASPRHHGHCPLVAVTFVSLRNFNQH